jgi:hypothetical protein
MANLFVAGNFAGVFSTVVTVAYYSGWRKQEIPIAQLQSG